MSHSSSSSDPTACSSQPTTEPAEQIPVSSLSNNTKKMMWASPPSSSKSAPVTSLATIMAEEESKAKVQRQQQEAEKLVREQEEMQLRLAMEASMADGGAFEASSTPSVAGQDNNMDQETRLAMALSLKESQREQTTADGTKSSEDQTVSVAAVAASTTNTGLSEQEMEQIEKALRDADKAQVDESLSLAMQLQDEEDAAASRKKRSSSDSHVRIMTRKELWQEEAKTRNHGNHFDDYQDEEYNDNVGFRMNSANPSQQQWLRLDRTTVVGPNQEVRTKHDVELASQANAHRLGLLDDAPQFVGNKAYNSFKQSMKRSTHKGVAAYGHGRATADTDKTKQGGMDSRVRTEIAKAINSGLVEMCNGVVKEGKEAIVYHANKGAESGVYDVAIKVFKRIQEFKERYSYVDGDPRYMDRKFNNASSREQLEIWAEKEFRNLTRANRGGVPVPTPLLQKENILFMRFLGEDGWPSPQLRELNLKKGSKKWKTLYTQTMDAIRRLYHKGRLVHGDLSEYNILVCPSQLVENRNRENDGDDSAVQIVLIDFGQAVDLRHPSSRELLQRDITRVKQFFDKMGVKTMATNAAEAFVLSSWKDDVSDDDEADEKSQKATNKGENTAQQQKVSKSPGAQQPQDKMPKSGECSPTSKGISIEPNVKRDETDVSEGEASKDQSCWTVRNVKQSQRFGYRLQNGNGEA